VLRVKLKYSPAWFCREINIVRKGEDGEVDSYFAGSRSKSATILSTPWGSFTCCVGRLRTLLRVSLRTFLVSLKCNSCRSCNHLILIPDLWRLAIVNLWESARKPSLSLSCSTLIHRIKKKVLVFQVIRKTKIRKRELNCSFNFRVVIRDSLLTPA
jgi:hypothetical protein